MRSALSKSTRALVLGAMMSGVPLIGIAQQAPAPDNTKANTNRPEHGRQAKQYRFRSRSDAASAQSDHGGQGYLDLCSQREGGYLEWTGHVVGTVRSNEEKQAVVEKTAQVAGKGHVVDQISVAPPKQ